jgi:haloacetate dehalogenase
MVSVPGGEIFARVGGRGRPLLLLHGYPQTHAMWHLIAPGLAEEYTVVCADLPGYGDSSKPPSTADHAAYSKRGMAASLVEMMRGLGFESFLLAGHDRGARVSYRMALDHQARVEKLVTLDIVPTYSQWRSLDFRGSLGSYHWYFLAQPAPLPERLIGGDPTFYLHNTLQRWAAPGFAFDPAAMAEYERAFANPETIRACCEDYRAGATTDDQIDAGDFGKRKITCPMLALWGQRSGAPQRDLLPTWREWADDVRGAGIPSGHFLAEEAPDATLAAMREFLAG